MGNIFRAGDVVGIGIQIEKNGRDFYNAMAAKAVSSEAADLFTFLAGEEEKHIAVFEGMRDALESHGPRESYSGECANYMRDLAGEHIFAVDGKGEEAAGGIENDGGGVDFGVAIEKESIIFYLGMKEAVPQSDHAAIDALIHEEQKHLKKLLDMKKKVNLVPRNS